LGILKCGAAIVALSATTCGLCLSTRPSVSPQFCPCNSAQGSMSHGRIGAVVAFLYSRPKPCQSQPQPQMLLMWHSILSVFIVVMETHPPFASPSLSRHLVLPLTPLRHTVLREDAALSDFPLTPLQRNNTHTPASRDDRFYQDRHPTVIHMGYPAYVYTIFFSSIASRGNSRASHPSS
jgi:hypothetical protein